MENLEVIDLTLTKIKELPSSIEQLEGPTTLDLMDIAVNLKACRRTWGD